MALRRRTGPAIASPAGGARLPWGGLGGHPLGASLHERTPPVGPDRDRQVAGGNTLVAEIRGKSQIFPNIYFSLM